MAQTISHKIERHLNKWVSSKIPGKRVVVLGDSHASVFQNIRFLIKFPAVRFHITSVGGATASGLSNPNSKTNALEIFKHSLDSNPGCPAIIMLGEVDCGFVIWHRMQTRGVPVEESFDRTLLSYFSFLKTATKDREVLVITPPLPTITDSSPMGEVANLRKEILANQRERARLTLDFAEAIRHAASEFKYSLIDLTVLSKGPDGLVAKRYLNTDPTDHHYDPRALYEILSSELRRTNFLKV